MTSGEGEAKGGRTGRRPGDAGTREAILDAAREAFGRRGYTSASLRAVAAAAGVDPSLVLHYFGSKQALFVAAVDLPIRPREVLPGVLAGDPAGAGARVVRFFVGIWDAAANRGAFLALIRSAVSDEPAARMLHDLLTADGPEAALRDLGFPDPELRAALVGSQLLGLALARYVVRLEPLASADADAVAALIGPTVQRYLHGDLPVPTPEERP